MLNRVNIGLQCHLSTGHTYIHVFITMPNQSQFKFNNGLFALINLFVVTICSEFKIAGIRGMLDTKEHCKR